MVADADTTQDIVDTAVPTDTAGEGDTEVNVWSLLFSLFLLVRHLLSKVSITWVRLLILVVSGILIIVTLVSDPVILSELEFMTI